MSDKIKVVIGVVVLVALGFWGYQSMQKAPAQNEVKVNPKETGPIKIGVALPLTGEAAAYGEASIGGAQLAVKEINDAGGINGRMIELIIEDDTCAPAGGATAVQKLVEANKVTALVGPLCSAAAGAGLPIAQSNGVPAIVIGSAPNLTKIGDYIFREYPSDSFQGKYIADFVYNTLGKKKVASIYVKNDWGQGVNDVFVARFKELGGEVVANESVLQDSRDLRTAVLKVKTSKPEAIFFPVYPGNAVAGLKQMKDAGLNVPIISGDVFADESIWKVKESAGVIYVQAKTNNPEDFQSKVKALDTTGKVTVINVFAPYTYDAVKIFAKAIEKVGTDKVAIKNEMAKMSYAGLAVPLVEFDENGDLKVAQYEILVIKNGKPEAYK